MNLDSFSVQSPCQDNGGCSQFCVLRPSGRTCICSTGMKLAEDGKTCKSLNLIVELLFLKSPSQPHRCFCSHVKVQGYKYYFYSEDIEMKEITVKLLITKHR